MVEDEHKHPLLIICYMAGPVFSIFTLIISLNLHDQLMRLVYIINSI